jgi:Nucleotidyl transferase AbiEii toxin, Type IV TA system
LADSWITLSREDQAEALEVAAAQTGRPPHLLEKDIWVVWTLSAIYESALAEKLTFKGGTSLSKVFKIIDRFSEDIDLTYDIREVVPDLLRNGNPIPASSSQAKKITDRVRERLPNWIEDQVLPILLSSLERDGLKASLSLAGNENEKLILAYEPIKVGTGYVGSTIQLEFGGRATGEPHQRHVVTCDMAPVIDGIAFPTAQPLVMAAERTFWEKATAAHVYCRQGRLRGDRFSRHWYDLAAMAHSGHAQAAIADRQLASAVAQHKSMFFAEKDSNKNSIDYQAAVGTEIQIIPEGGALEALEKDYAATLEDGLLATNKASFAEIMDICTQLQGNING